MVTKKPPTHVIGNAIRVAKAATQEKNDKIKDEAAVSLGRRGGKARAEKLSPERRLEIAKKAAAVRWRKAK